MSERVSTIDIRQRIGHLLDRVALRHDEFIIERKGKPLAALVSVERLDQMRRAARRGLLDFLEQQLESGRELSDDEAEQLGLDAQRWARGLRPESRRK